MLDDPNGPGGTFTHWITYDIPAAAAGLGEGQSGPKTGSKTTPQGGPCS
jgi:phosphatidylethanolamine-binding protein (PEBP) family uncharacterized protein